MPIPPAHWPYVCVCVCASVHARVCFALFGLHLIDYTFQFNALVSMGTGVRVVYCTSDFSPVLLLRLPARIENAIASSSIATAAATAVVVVVVAAALCTYSFVIEES